MNKVKIDWTNFITDCNKLADRIKNYNDTVIEKITDIFSIARGGGIPSEIVAYKCGINNICSIGMSYYDLNNNRLDVPIIYQDVPTNLQTKKILIVDEICDSGSTFVYITQKIKEHGCLSVGTACVYRKKGSMFLPDIYIQEVPKDEWLVMPYD